MDAVVGISYPRLTDPLWLTVFSVGIAFHLLRLTTFSSCTPWLRLYFHNAIEGGIGQHEEKRQSASLCLIWSLPQHEWKNIFYILQRQNASKPKWMQWYQWICCPVFPGVSPFLLLKSWKAQAQGLNTSWRVFLGLIVLLILFQQKRRDPKLLPICADR